MTDTVRTQQQLLDLIDLEGSNISLGKSVLDRQVLRDLVVSISSLGGGGLSQTAYAETSAEQTIGSTIPNDGTIPQDSEGVAATGLSVVVTPNDVNNNFEFLAQLHIGGGTITQVTIALFVAGQADAIATALHDVRATDEIPHGILFKRIVGTALPAPSPSWTFSIRVGASFSPVINGSGTVPAQPRGATQFSFLRVAEIAT